MNALFDVATSYTWLAVVYKMAPADYARLREALRVEGSSTQLPEEQPTTNEAAEAAGLPKWGWNEVATLPLVQALTQVGIECTVRKVRGLHYERPLLPGDAPVQLPPSGTTIINVSVAGGVGLLEVRTVTWLEDACTMDLQRHLDDGWRILAVCPPNDSRRPTYIIGHTTPKKDT